MSPQLLDLRPTTIEDAALLSDLETLIHPEDPRDPVMMAFWWTHLVGDEKAHRLINTRDGVVRTFVYAGHNGLAEDPRRFGFVRVRLHPDDWSDDAYRELVAIAERWLRDEGALTAVAKPRDDEPTPEILILHELGYTEERRLSSSRLDLVAGRERLLAAAERTGTDMERQGIALMTLEKDTDPERWRKLYDLDIETTDDVPKSAPWPVPTYDEWHSHWFDNPAHTPERFWIARAGESILGLSVIGYPPVRGMPWTSFTSTARNARGRGIARALKYASVKQAIELGARQVETSNDAENAPILHLNREMGYQPSHAVIELHRAL